VNGRKSDVTEERRRKGDGRKSDGRKSDGRKSDGKEGDEGKAT
jgi:hypothetical protein